MKGTSFQKPLELKIEVDGEKWRQGDEVRGKLLVRNLGSEAITTTGLGVALARGHIKAVQTKAADAFEWLSHAGLSVPAGDSIPPGAAAELDFRFPTGLNAPVTDKSSSLYVVYGRTASRDAAQSAVLSGTGFASLQLTMVATPAVDELLNQIQVHHKFVVKGIKALTGKSDGIEFKLAPPSSRSYATLDHLLLKTRFSDEESLEIDFVFVVHKLETPGVKGKVSYGKTLHPTEYKTASGRIAFEKLASVIREGLDLVESKLSF